MKAITLTQTRFTLSPGLSLPRVAERLPFTYTGADFYALCSDAMLKAVTRQASAVDSKIAFLNSANPDETNSKAVVSRSLEKAISDSERPDKITPAYFFDHYAESEDIAVQVTEEDFMLAQQELIPSVSAKELEHYARVRAQFESVGEREAREATAREEAEKANGTPDRKGKGKAPAANGSVAPQHMPLRPKTNGTRRGSGGKGKGKAVADDEDEGYKATNGFGNAADDDDLY